MFRIVRHRFRHRCFSYLAPRNLDLTQLSCISVPIYLNIQHTTSTTARITPEAEHGMTVRWLASSTGRCFLQPRQRVRSSTCDPTSRYGLNILPVRFGGSVAAAKVEEEHESEGCDQVERVIDVGTRPTSRTNDLAGKLR
jgi:hypothetical protein